MPFTQRGKLKCVAYMRLSLGNAIDFFQNAETAACHCCARSSLTLRELLQPDAQITVRTEQEPVSQLSGNVYINPVLSIH